MNDVIPHLDRISSMNEHIRSFDQPFRLHPHDRAPRAEAGEAWMRKSGGVREWSKLGLLVSFLVTVLFPAASARAEITAAQVQQSLDRGVAYLLKQQDAKSGGWPVFPSYSGGMTSLCTLALLNAGVSSTDPSIQSALSYLRRIQPNRTYAVALQTLVFCQVNAAGDRPRIQRNIQWLTESQNASGKWSYGGGMGVGGDASNTQFALLALAAAADRGMAVDRAVFQKSFQYWAGAQDAGGGWRYAEGRPVIGSMTCAGIASMIICEEHLPDAYAALQKDAVECCGAVPVGMNPVEAGLDQLARMFSTRVNPQASGAGYFYYMYALERVGRLTGRRYIGEHDWYREGAENLIRQQDSFDGFWRGQSHGEQRQLVATSFALLFLGKGKRQVVVSRLSYPGTSNAGWNQHPTSLKQLVRHVERDWRRDLSWQTIDIQVAGVQDLLQSPVLIISGSRAGQWTPAHRDVLKEYVEQGGTIVFESEGGEGCGDARPFQRQIAEMCTTWYPENRLEKLPLEHPAWYAERRVDPTHLGDDFWIYGVQVCCRTPIFVLPKSLSCRWGQSAALLSRTSISPTIKRELQAAVSVGENIIAYATGRELKEKLTRRMILESGSDVTPQRGAILFGELAMDAGGQDARRALPHAVSLIGKTLPVMVTTAERPVGFDTEALSKVQFLWIHGRTEFQWSEAQRSRLAEFLDRGGCILANAVCGSPAFTQSFRQEIRRILPDASWSDMRGDHVAFSNRFQGYDVRSVTIRQPTQQRSSQQIASRTSHPQIEMGRVNGLANVFLSPLDLSCALESQNSVQCPGYSTEDATMILSNLVLYFMQQSPERE